ncbi:Homeobox protein invected [Folsomia candida]|uniref:Homeobox protein invected n=2 Tax=Folsomia candida TaxID=158441 RepID=A0A226DCT4_FOLCA|nr:Homeobox protein invected [Folsomia candida]
MNGSDSGRNKCFDFSIENLLRVETGSRKVSQTFSHVGFIRTDYATLGGMDLRGSNSKTVESHRQNMVSSSPLSQEMTRHEEESPTLSWLNCTRFNPPKVTRSRKRPGVQERRPGRGPRIPFSPGQISLLEKTFSKSRYLSSDSIARLASALNLSNDRVKIWFQNRRARFKREVGSHSSVRDQLSPISRPSTSHTHWTTTTTRSANLINLLR